MTLKKCFLKKFAVVCSGSEQQRRSAEHRFARRFAGLGVLLLAAVSATASLHAQNVDKNWDNGGGDQDWSNPLNWSSDTLPATGTGNNGDNLHFNTLQGSHAIYTVAQGTSVYRYIRIGDTAGGNNAVLEVTGGNLSSDNTTPTRIATGGRTATLNQSGGTLAFGGYVQLGLDANSVGTINLSGGLLNAYRNGTVGGVTSVSIALGDGNNAQGNIVLSGGELRTRTGILLGANGGRGRFEVRGAGVANVGTDNSADDGFWVQSSNSVLAAYVDNGSLGTIYVTNLGGSTGTYSDGNVIFMPGAKLEVGFLGVTNSGTWDLMTWDGVLLTNGLSFVAGTPTNWSFQFVTNNGGSGPDTLRLKYSGAAPPLAPTVLRKVPGNGQVELHWLPVSGATSYQVRAGTSSGGPYSLTNSTSGTNFASAGLVNGATYFFVVTAVNAQGESGYSTEVSARPLLTTFLHPGGMHTQADFDRMKTKVAANAQPWLDGWNKLLANSHAQLSWTPNPKPVIYRGFDGVNPENYAILFNDIAAAYQCALRYHVSGDAAYADKAVQILNAWSGTLTNLSGTSDRFLASGIYGYQFANAGEMLRHYPGWSATDFAQFQTFMRDVFYPMNRDFLRYHNNACISHYWANWDLCNMASLASIAVLCDDAAMFADAVEYFKTGAGNGAIGNAVYYVHPGALGQWQESGRDQGHNTLGLALMGPLCEVAWNQGVDLYGYAGNRFLSGSEYTTKYNLFNPVPYVTYDNCDGVNQTNIASADQGATRACMEMIYNHYVNRRGLSAPYTTLAAAAVRPEGGGGDYGPNSGGYDQLGFGTLTYTRDPSGVTPPTLPAIPVGVVATPVTCGAVEISWPAVAGATGYNVMRSGTSGGPYTNLLALNLAATNFTDAEVVVGMTYHYVVSALNGGGESAHSTQAVVTATAGALPNGWMSADIGAVGAAGDANYCGGVFTVLGAGSDIGGTADSFHFAYTTLTNNGEIIAHWATVQTLGSNDKIGVVLRESTAANSRAVVLLYDETNAQNRTRMAARTSTGGNMTYLANGPTGTTVPLWLRLARTNSTFTGSTSTDGTNWSLVTTTTVSGLPANLLAGLAVTSRNPAVLNVSTFDSVSVSGVWPPTVSTTPTSLAAIFNGSGLQLTWPATHVGWRLEVQTNSLVSGLGTNWFTVFGSAATNQIFLPINPTAGSVFLRLVYP